MIFLKMPAVSKQQFKLIQVLRHKYKTRENAPKKAKWAFDKDCPVKRAAKSINCNELCKVS